MSNYTRKSASTYEEARKLGSLVDKACREYVGHDNWDELYSDQKKIVEDMLKLQFMPVHGGVAEVIVFYKNPFDEEEGKRLNKKVDSSP